MENAAKALQIAASILISVMILSLLVIGYSNLSETRRIQHEITSREQNTDFNKRFDSYNKEKLYGSEVLALSNMIDDYNNRYSEDEGYTRITPIDPKRMGLNASTYRYYAGNSANGTLSERNDALVKKINEVANKTKELDGKKYTYKELNSMSERALRSLFGGNSYEVLLEEYNKLLTEQKDFARLEFKNIVFEYDNNTGRVIKISVSV